jgi:hypothetical protein
MARKGQFKKGGGRHGGGTSRSKSRRSTSLVVIAPPRAPARRKRSGHAHAAHHRKHRRKSSGGATSGCTIPKLIGTTLVLANVAGTNNGPLGATVYNVVQKIPGAKTFGGAAVAGMTIGAIHKFTRFGGSLRPLMKCAGLVGIIAAAIKLGEQGTAFKWLGGDDVMEVE